MRKYLLFIGVLLVTGLGCAAAASTFDKAARAAWVSALGIKPNIEFYNSSNRDNYWDHYFPKNAPLSAEEAEANNMVGITTLGENYQYKSNRGYFRKRCSIENYAFDLNLDTLENGTHFFSVDAQNQLRPIKLPETFTQKTYLKIVKEMGKILKIEQVTLEWSSTSLSEYWPDGEFIRYKTIQRYDNHGELLEKIVSEYDQKGVLAYDLTYDNQGQKRVMIMYEAGHLKERFIFDAAGYKTNHIIYGPIEVEENRSYDRKGNVISISKERPEEFLPIDIFAKPDCSNSE